MSMLAENLRRRRQFIGYSLMGLAMDASVPVDLIVAIESGRITEPAPELLDRLAQTLHTDAVDLQATPVERRLRFEVIQGGRAQRQNSPEVA